MTLKIGPDKKLNRENASAAAAASIREAIIAGQLRPGQRLKEGDLAEALGISRTPIREALMLLQVDGLITTLPRRGSVVRAFEASELADMLQLRIALEDFAARQACERRTSADLVALEESIVRLDAFDVTTTKVLDIWRENVVFHIAIAEAGHALKLVEFMRSLFDLPAAYHPIFSYTKENKDLFVSQHRRIAAALSARDGESAAQLTRDHVLEARGLALEAPSTSSSVANGAATGSRAPELRLVALPLP